MDGWRRRIEDWTLVFAFDPKRDDVDVILRISLKGNVRTALSFGGVQGVETTEIVEVCDDQLVRTRNSVYELGTPADSYRRLLDTRHLRFEANCPIPMSFRPGSVV